jgi:hypothetical protein
MVKLRHTGPGYRGFDSGRRALLEVRPGGVVEVSDKKAEQLLSDFPGQWEIIERVETQQSSRRRGRVRRAKPAVPLHEKGVNAGGSEAQADGATDA